MEIRDNLYAYYPWVQALIEDDVAVVQELLNDAGNWNNLLEMWFPADILWNNLPEEDATSYRIATIRRSWTLAAVCGSYKVMKHLYAAGVDINQVDSLGNNVIHTLIIYTSKQKRSAEFHLKTYHYIISLISRKEILSLLQSENRDGLRPVELASHFQAFLLLNAIFNTRDAYLQKSIVCGLTVVDYFDVSDYESTENHRPVANSPLFLTIFSHDEKLHKQVSAENFTSGIIGNWLRCKQGIFVPIIALWAIFRIAVIALVLVIEIPVLSNKTAPYCAILRFNPSVTTRYMLNTSLSLIATLCLTYDIYDIIFFRTFLPAWRKTYSVPYGEVMAQYAFYRVFQIIYNTCLLFYGILRIVSDHRGYQIVPIFVHEASFLVIIFGSVWSMLYFVQLSSMFGNYVIAMQRMLVYLAKFSVIICVFFIPFASVFPRFIQPVNGTCPTEFGSVTASFYTTFTVILNMINFHNFSTPSPEGLWLVHVCFVSIVSILLLNFLIAVFSDAYREVASHAALSLNVQWLLIITVVENRIPKVMRPLLETRKKKYFHYSNGRYFMKFARIVSCASTSKQTAGWYRDCYIKRHWNVDCVCCAGRNSNITHTLCNLRMVQLSLSTYDQVCCPHSDWQLSVN